MNNNHAWSKSRYSVVNAKQGRLQKPVVIILFGYSLILIPSTLILMTEFASVTGLDWIDALFTATSALTVTGLGVVDTGTHFSAVGQVWLMLLMQLGGLGQMTLSVLILLTLGKSIGLKEQAVVREELNQDFGTDIVSLIKVIIVFALTMELIGTVILSTVWVPEFGLAQGIYTAVFHSISSFNNAGFSLFSASMSDYSHSPIVTLTISLLFIIGGLGFTVIIDLIKIKKNDHSKKRYTLSLHTKLVLIGSFVLLFGGAIAIGLLESNNSKTLGGHDLLSTSLMSFFQSATARTAGFYSINIIDMTHAGLLVMMVLMFIGAGSTSTGGGIKVSTFVVAIIAKRNIAPLVVLKALAIIVVSFAILLTSAFALMLTEDARFDVVLFEAISAFSTVGLTAGLTENLSPTGKFIMIFLMIIGRIGPITLALLAASPNTSRIKYADEEVITG